MMKSAFKIVKIGLKLLEIWLVVDPISCRRPVNVAIFNFVTDSGTYITKTHTDRTIQTS